MFSYLSQTNPIRLNYSKLFIYFGFGHKLFTTQSQLLMIPWKKPLLKTFWEKEKMLVCSIFSFSQNVFYPVIGRNRHFSEIYFVCCECFQFGPVQSFVFWQRINENIPCMVKSEILKKRIFCFFLIPLFLETKILMIDLVLSV